MRTVATRGTSFDAIVTIHECAYFFDLASPRLAGSKNHVSRFRARGEIDRERHTAEVGCASPRVE